MAAREQKLEQLRRGLADVLDEAMRADGASFGKIRVAVDDIALEVQAHRGFSERFIEAFRAVTPDDPLPSARAARLGKRVAVPDLARHDGDAPFVAAARDEGVRAMQATPIVASSGRLLGVLATHFSRPCHVSAASAIALDYWAGRAAELIEGLLP